MGVCVFGVECGVGCVVVLVDFDIGVIKMYGFIVFGVIVIIVFIEDFCVRY